MIHMHAKMRPEAVWRHRLVLVMITNKCLFRSEVQKGCRNVIHSVQVETLERLLSALRGIVKARLCYKRTGLYDVLFNRVVRQKCFRTAALEVGEESHPS